HYASHHAEIQRVRGLFHRFGWGIKKLVSHRALNQWTGLELAHQQERAIFPDEDEGIARPRRFAIVENGPINTQRQFGGLEWIHVRGDKARDGFQRDRLEV